MRSMVLFRMEIIVILLSVCLHAQSAKQVGHSEDAQLDDLLNMLWQETTTQRASVFDLTTQPQPYFEAGLSPANNSVQLGGEITLHCNVKDLSDETKVSWMRRHGDKLNLLSVGPEKYTNDPRFTPGFRAPHDWQLRLQAARQPDQGFYECQVSSHPPIIQSFYLTVLVPELKIGDGRDMFYNSGSTIELRCMISKVPDHLHVITWRLGDKVLNYDTNRGGISVKTDINGDGAMSRLFIANANQHDSGNYTCSLGDIAHSSVMVVVLNGEAPAAMHVGKSSSVFPGKIQWLLVFLPLLYTRIFMAAALNHRKITRKCLLEH